MTTTPSEAVIGPAGRAAAKADAATAAEARGSGRTLAVTAAGTLLVLAVFSAGPATVEQTAHAFGSGVSGQTWALSGMSLGLAAALLTVGTLADALGRRRVLVWSAAALVVTSALAAAAPSMAVFVAARVLQGVAGAGVVAASLGTIGHTFPAGRARTHATGVWGAAVGGGIALGPVAGAALTAAVDWRSAYWLQVLAAAALAPAALSLTESRAANPRKLDAPGAATLAAAMAALTAGLIEGRASWTSATTIVLLAAGVVLLGVFAAIELRVRAPVLDLRLLRQPLFVASLSGALFTGVAVIGLMSYSLGFDQRALGVSVLGSAGILLVWSATSMVVALVARRLPHHVPANLRLAAGLALAAVGEAALTGLGAASSWTRLIPGLVIAGVGSGLANAALGQLAVESVPRDRAGMGSGANNTARYLGSAIGVTVVVAIISARHDAATPAGLAGGWNVAAIVTAAIAVLGALVIALRR